MAGNSELSISGAWLEISLFVVARKCSSEAAVTNWYCGYAFGICISAHWYMYRNHAICSFRISQVWSLLGVGWWYGKRSAQTGIDLVGITPLYSSGLTVELLLLQLGRDPYFMEELRSKVIRGGSSNEGGKHYPSVNKPSRSKRALIQQSFIQTLPYRGCTSTLLCHSPSNAAFVTTGASTVPCKCMRNGASHQWSIICD